MARSYLIFGVALLLALPAMAGLPDTVAKVRPSIVGVGTVKPPKRVNADGPAINYFGTGFVVGNGRQVVTNFHVVPQKLDVDAMETVAVFLGAALGLSPVGAWVAVRPSSVRVSGSPATAADDARAGVAGRTLRESVCYQGAQGPAADRFYAFDKKTGELVWSSSAGDRPKDNSFSHPQLSWHGGKRVFYTALGQNARPARQSDDRDNHHRSPNLPDAGSRLDAGAISQYAPVHRISPPPNSVAANSPVVIST